MIKDLIKVANRLDSLGLTKEADYLDLIIIKIAQDNSNQYVTRQIDGQTLVIDSILNKLIIGNSVKDKPKKFQEWLLNTPSEIKKKAYLFFQQPIWKDYGYEYIQTIPPLGPESDFYSNLLRALGAKESGTSDLDKIYKNLDYWSRKNVSAMKSNKDISEVAARLVGEALRNTSELLPRETAEKISILDPFKSLEALKNPAVVRETEKTFEELIDADKNSVYFPVSVFLGAPLTFGRGLTRLATGNYSGAANDIVFSAISTAAGYGIGKLFAVIPASSFGKKGGSEITKLFWQNGTAAVGAGVVDQVRKSIQDGIMSDKSYTDEQKERLMTEVNKVPDEKIKEQLETKLKEEIINKTKPT